MRIIRNIIYDSNTGDAGRGDMFLPEEVPTGKGYPVVLTIHGGGWSSMTKESFEGVSAFLAENGFAVFNLNYRLAPENQYPACVEDCLKAAHYLLNSSVDQSALNLDRSKISLVGASAGGHLALMTGLTLPSESVAAIVSVSGIDDVFSDFTLFPERYELLWGHLPTKEELLRINPTDSWHMGAPSILCTHFRGDLVVTVDSCRDFERKISAKGGNISVYIYDLGRENQGHGIWVPESSPHRLYPDIECVILAFLKNANSVSLKNGDEKSV